MFKAWWIIPSDLLHHRFLETFYTLCQIIVSINSLVFCARYAIITALTDQYCHDKVRLRNYSHMW